MSKTISQSGTMTISDSSCSSGAGLYAQSGIDGTITGTTLSGNVASSNGGAFYLSTATGWLLDTVVLDGNEAVYGGAGYLLQSELELLNSTVQLNTADYGGGVAMDSLSTLLSTKTDWATDKLDNAPEDIYMVSSTTTFGFDGVHTFTCSGAGDDCI